mmetsp:Transcript_19070/g.35607  ORF Transcript_19070/g.35607 Transcript_19070/m.35607 type:complete len:620 (-) Transcript_19070:2518-4377(-)
MKNECRRNHLQVFLALVVVCTSWNITSLQLSLAFASSSLDTGATVSSTSSTDRSSCDDANANNPSFSSPSTATTTISSSSNLLILANDNNRSLARRRIQSGRVYVHPNFLSKDQLRHLQNDMKTLQSDGRFVVNGLSDVRKGLKGETLSSSTSSSSNNDGNDGGVNNDANQGFDVKYDRSVCPIPWWKDALSVLTTGDDSSSFSNDALFSSLPTDDNGDGNTNTNDEENILLHSIQIKLQQLRHDLSLILDRPTMRNNHLGHECYYSQSTPGSSLARHMDERHEETKGTRGWLLPSRRSLSWLIYLSETDKDNNDESDDDERDDDVTMTTTTSTNDDTVDHDNGDDDGNNGVWNAHINGGLLRTFPQKQYRRSDDYDDKTWEGTAECGSHNGNLQVGWILAKEDRDESGGGSGYCSDDNDDGDGERRMMSTTTMTMTTHPVFLDSWFDHINPYTGVAEPHCILYIVYKKTPISDDDGDEGTRIEYITVPWSIDAVEGNMAEFLQHRARLESNSSKKSDDPTSSSSSSSLFLHLEYAQQFHLLEDRDAWMRRGEGPPAGSVVEDHVPVRGTLVVFDSVTLPHEVTAVVEGRRAALAGWFHEETQPLGGMTNDGMVSCRTL